MGKIADPRTIKSFVGENETVGDITVAEYLSRLAFEAATIINAEDYGRSIYDLAIRRSLIGIGEDMVNIAYDAPVDMAPRDQIEAVQCRVAELYPGKVRYLREERDGQLVEDDPECPER